MTRRDFIRTTSLAAAGCAAGCASFGTARPLKVGVFADLHYYPATFAKGGDSPEFLERILSRAQSAGCDMVIHLGDFVHNVSRPGERALIRLYNDSALPSYHILGNHDQDGTTVRQVLDAYRMPGAHYSFDRGGFRFVVADPNYFCNEPGRFVHHELGNYYGRAKGSTINWIPPEQLEWMRETIVGSPLPCVVLSHQSFERAPSDVGVHNGAAVRAIFREANARRPGQVRLAMSGHMHVDYRRMLDDVLFWEVNSANYYWYGGARRTYPEDYRKAHRFADNCLAWDAPLSAILTLWPDGRIRIEGSEAGWLYGVDPVMAGQGERDCAERLIRPLIASGDYRIPCRENPA